MKARNRTASLPSRFAVLAWVTALSGAAPGAEPAEPARADATGSLGWADCEGDGDLDLLAVRQGALHLFRNDAGQLVEVTEEAGLADLAEVSFALWADHDADGDADLFVASRTGPSRMLRNTAGSFEDVTAEVGLAHDGCDLFAGWTDLDGDGALDLLVRGEATTTLYENRGAGWFESRDLELGGVEPTGALDLSLYGLEALQAAGLTLVACDPENDRGAGGGGPVGGMWGLDPSDPAQPPAEMQQQVGGMAVSAGSLLDQSTGSSFLEASSDPTLGMLYPLSEDLFVESGSGHVGLGTTNPAFSLHVTSDDNTTAFIESTLDDSFAVGLRVDNTNGVALKGSTGASGLYGVQGSGPTGVFGFSYQGDGVEGLTDAANGHGVYGHISNSGGGSGVYGKASHASTYGVRAQNTHPSGTALRVDGATGINVTGTNGYGVVAVSTETTPGVGGIFASGPVAGVYAEATEVDGVATGVYGQTASNTGGIGVHGKSTATNYDTIGVLGETLNGYGYGVVGHSMGIGVQGEGDIAGIYGLSSGAYGVSGYCTGIAGVRGVADSTSGYGGLFEAWQDGSVALVANNTSQTGDIIVARNQADTEFRVNSSGNVYCDLAFNGGGADYAEWLPKLDPAEELAPGDVVGLFDGRISKRTQGARRVLVLSTNPVLVGNALDAEQDEREGHAITAFLGQVPVAVRGPVRAGDLLVPSGLEDGSARALSFSSVKVDDLLAVIGTAWEGAEGDGPHLVNAGVGIDPQSAVAQVLVGLQSELQGNARHLKSLETRLAALENRAQEAVLAQLSD